MIFKFVASIFILGKRAFIKVPFNVWDKTGLKGNIPSKISFSDISFECKLIPKGDGVYFIPVAKKFLSKKEEGKEYEIKMEIIEKLSRIDSCSPYSRENPIRVIDSISIISVPKGLCGHACVAMLAGISLKDIITLMGKGPASWSKIMEALDYYGITYAPKVVHTRGKEFKLPPCCILHNDNRFILWYKNSYCGVSDVDGKNTIGYLEISVL